MDKYNPQFIVTYAIDAALERGYRRLGRARKLFKNKDLRAFNEFYIRSKELIQKKERLMTATLPLSTMIAEVQAIAKALNKFTELTKQYVASYPHKTAMTSKEWDEFVNRTMKQLGFNQNQ